METAPFWHFSMLPIPMSLQLGKSKSMVSFEAGTATLETLNTETTVNVVGCANYLTINAKKGESFVGQPINWIPGSSFYWVHPLGTEGTIEKIQFEILARPIETRPAQSLHHSQMYLVRNTQTDKFFRVITITVEEEKSEVFFVDLGLRYIVGNKKLYETMNEPVLTTPPSAVPIRIMFNNKAQDPQNVIFERALKGEFVRIKFEYLDENLFGYNVQLVGNEGAGTGLPLNEVVQQMSEMVL